MKYIMYKNMVNYLYLDHCSLSPLPPSDPDLYFSSPLLYTLPLLLYIKNNLYALNLGSFLPGNYRFNTQPC